VLNDILRRPLGALPLVAGLAVTPANFPDFTIQDADHAFTLAKDAGDYAVLINPRQRSAPALELPLPGLL